MGAFLDQPLTEKTTASGEIHGLKYAFSAMQGWRKDMEDAHICTAVKEWNNWSFFGVFDGHAGASVSKLLNKDLLASILENTEPEYKNGHFVEESFEKGTVKGFLAFDADLRLLSDFRDEKDRGGSTAVTAFVSPTHVIWANCGDSRGFLCRNEMVHFSTEDHKPMNFEEKKRIETAGGSVVNQRVNGTLAVSRALGDFEYKKNPALPAELQLVSPVPDVNAIAREEGDEFLLLACDGIYDVMTNEEICKYIHRQLSLTSDLQSICSNLLDLCLNKNSRDNMSAILVIFPGAPEVSELAIKKQAELDAKAKTEIEAKLREYVKEATNRLDVDEQLLVSRLNETLDSAYDIFSRKKWIYDLLEVVKKEKFGEIDDFSDADMDEGGCHGKPIRASVFTAEGITETVIIPASDIEQEQGDNPFSPLLPQGTSVDEPSPSST